ncbi:MAG: Phosphoglucosamine mutase [Negativicoccus succinicivorans DORA_17_25]|uniref:Phosphoglucosamine mutase n=1 Tax=Negativicoccus succinicivorans DORA_17_25 TaxID=1403945 RepID=W1U4M4_9FIRM|nr:MAG: Phosphoglucosamine mutase [Negativicoccus succinicivorans DORA_17_25]
MIDETGAVLDGDHILLLAAQQLKSQNKLKNDTVVATVMSNIGFKKALEKMGLKAVFTSVGDRYVLEEMRAHDYVLGGEQSGHVIFLDYNTTGDGVLTAVQTLAIMKQSGRKLSELAQLMTTYPQILRNVRVYDKESWQDNPFIMAAIGEAEDELGENGRILVRASGTEPLLRVMAEGPDHDQLERIVTDICAIIQREIGSEE